MTARATAHRTTRRTIARWAVGAALGATALAGCTSTPTSDTAAVVDGSVIKESDVQQAASQLTTAVTPEQPVSPGQVLDLAIKAKAINAYAEDRGRAVAPSVVRAPFAEKGINDPNPVALDVLGSIQALNQFRDPASGQLDQVTGQAILEKLTKASVTVNPRYGTWNAAETSLAADTPDWLDPQGAPAAQPTG